MATLAELAKKLNKEYKTDKLIVKSNVIPKYERLASGALGMDYPLFGGLPEGRICIYSGLQHSGKTTAACCELAAYQRKYPNKTCVFVDAEHSLDLKHQARMNGIDLSKMYYVNVPSNMSGEQVCDLIVELEKSDDIGLIVLDSLPALLPQQVLENDLTKDNGITFTGIQKWKEPCGGAPQFLSSVSIRFGTRKFTLGDNMDACGATNGEGADGFRLQFKVIKNKTAPCNRGGGFITYRYETGLDWVNDLLEIALGFDFIKRINNVTYSLINLETGEVYLDEEGKELTGKKATLLEYIKTNIKFQNEYLAMLNRFISASDESYGSLLDARASAEIDAQEAAIAENTVYNN